MRLLLDPPGQAAGWRSTLGRVSRATTIRTPASSHGRGRGRDSPPSLFPPSLPPSQTDTLPCRPARDSDYGSGCTLQPPLPPRPPIRCLFRWLSLRCPPNLGGPPRARLGWAPFTLRWNHEGDWDSAGAGLPSQPGPGFRDGQLSGR